MSYTRTKAYKAFMNIPYRSIKHESSNTKNKNKEKVE